MHPCFYLNSYGNSESTLSLVHAPFYKIVIDLNKTAIPFFITFSNSLLGILPNLSLGLIDTQLFILIQCIMQPSQDKHNINFPFFKQKINLHFVKRHNLICVFTAQFHSATMLKKLHSSAAIAVDDITFFIENWDHFTHGPFS